MSKALDTQVGGEHYRKQKIQPIEYIHANGLDFIQGCVVKYITRFRDKNGKEDLLKIKHYIDLLIELEYPEENGAVFTDENGKKVNLNDMFSEDTTWTGETPKACPTCGSWLITDEHGVVRCPHCGYEQH